MRTLVTGVLLMQSIRVKSRRDGGVPSTLHAAWSFQLPVTIELRVLVVAIPVTSAMMHMRRGQTNET